MSRPLLDQAVYKFIDAKLSKVSGVFTKYRNDYPQNMRHDVHEKCYVRGDDFNAVLLINVSPEEYLNAVSVVFGDQQD